MKGNLDAGNYVPVALDLIALGSGMKSEPYQLGAYTPFDSGLVR